MTNITSKSIATPKQIHQSKYSNISNMIILLFISCLASSIITNNNNNNSMIIVVDAFNSNTLIKNPLNTINRIRTMNHGISNGNIDQMHKYNYNKRATINQYHDYQEDKEELHDTKRHKIFQSLSASIRNRLFHNQIFNNNDISTKSSSTSSSFISQKRHMMGKKLLTSSSTLISSSLFSKQLTEVTLSSATASIAPASTTTSIATSSLTKLLTSLTSFLSPKLNTLSTKQIIKLCIVASITTYLSYDMYTTRKRQKKDPTSEWSRYSNNPIARGQAFTLIFLKIMPLAALSNIVAKTTLREVSGTILSKGLLKLGPLYIKIGQILSCRKELLYKEWITSLETLQDNVPAKSGKDAINLAIESFGSKQDMDNTLSYFDNVPIAAASLGQVHKAILKDTNETVVIKIQRSKLRELYDKDLKLMKYIATNADKTVAFINKLNAKKKNKNNNGNADADDYTGMNQNYTEIFVDAETILYREINYTMEALNTIQFANDFGIGYGGLPLESNNEQSSSSSSNDDKVVLDGASSWIRVPYIYKKYSTEKVLVMEYGEF